MQKLDKLMPDIIKTAEAPDIPPHVRDGYVMMFIYLPGTFGDKFSPYVGDVIPAILQVGFICGLSTKCKILQLQYMRPSLTK